jgi:hypothetical protein
MFACFLLVMLHLLDFLLKQLGYEHNFLIIQFNLFKWITQVNLYFKHFMTIAYQLKLMLNFLLLISIGINVKLHVAHTHTHTQNGLTKSFIKQL